MLGALHPLSTTRQVIVLIMGLMLSLLLLPPHILLHVHIMQSRLLTLVHLHICAASMHDY